MMEKTKQKNKIFDLKTLNQRFESSKLRQNLQFKLTKPDNTGKQDNAWRKVIVLRSESLINLSENYKHKKVDHFSNVVISN